MCVCVCVCVCVFVSVYVRRLNMETNIARKDTTYKCPGPSMTVYSILRYLEDTGGILYPETIP